MEFGMLANTLHENVEGLSPEDISRHIYILGGTGSGKSTLIRNLYKHLECANYTGTLDSAIIYIDVKDEDAKMFLRQSERRSFDLDRVTYLDINHIPFAVNLLELPEYHPQNRDTIVSRMVGHIIEMFREFYSQPKTFVQMERILRLLLFYLYSNTDNPTMLDLYDVINRLQNDGKSEMQQVLRIFKKITGPEMENALHSISSLPRESWTPLLNRIEMFATDPYLKSKFAVKHTTINFKKMLEPANITIFRISDSETPRYAHGLAIMAILIKIWFMIQYRVSQDDEQKKTLVVLTLDEFQKVQDLSIITSILSQARSYNLGLILSHQNTAQIDTVLLETIVGNTSTQIYGRVSGIDASRIGRIIDPAFTKEITDQIATQPDFVFTMKSRPPQGQQHRFPIQFQTKLPPPLNLDEQETVEFIQTMKNRYKATETIQSALISEECKKIDWMRQLYTKFRVKEEWDIIKFLNKENGNLTKIVEAVKSYSRDHTSHTISQLRAEGVIRVAHSRKIGRVIENEFALSTNSKILYFPQSFEIIGLANDINDISKKAFDYYLERDFFVSLAMQSRKKYEKMCDMVAYDYHNDDAISIEIESSKEVESHPEQVRFNMIKWKDLGFVECHVWSKSRKINEIKNNLGKEAEKVRIFIV